LHQTYHDHPRILEVDHCFRHGISLYPMFPGALIVILNFLLLVNARVVDYVLFWTFEFVRTKVLGFVARVARQIEFPWKLQYDLQRQVEGAW
jgi:hypothetical protein